MEDNFFTEQHWNWRYRMAKCLADTLDFARFGIKRIFIIGSSNNGTAGPGSDIDLLIHIGGTEEQKRQLLLVLEGWSACLAEINHIKTGYICDGLLDVHFVTDEDIRNKTAFAVMIGSVTDPASLLRAADEDLTEKII